MLKEKLRHEWHRAVLADAQLSKVSKVVGGVLFEDVDN